MSREKDPTISASAYTYWLRGGAAWRKGDEKQARAHMHEAIDTDPKYARALASLAQYYAYQRFSEPSSSDETERKEQCRGLARRAIAADQTDPFVLTTVASIFVMVGEIGDALRYADLAFALSPRDMIVLVTKGYALCYAGRHSEGLSLIEKACSLEPRLPPDFISALADCYFLAHRFDDALATYRTLINPPLYFRLNEAACLSQLGRKNEVDLSLIRASGFDAVTYGQNCAKMCAR